MAYGFGLQRAGNRCIVGLSPERLPGPSANKACMEGLAYKGPSCSVMTAESGMNFSQEVPPFLFEDAPLKDTGSAFLIKPSLMDFIGFRSPHYAACLILVLGKFLPSSVGQEWFCPRGDDGHYHVG